MKKQILVLIILFLWVDNLKAQTQKENKKFSLHGQTTLIPQGVNNFHSPYSGENSFLPTEPIRTSFTTTLFAAYKPFKNAYIVFNPEIAGGKGLSKTTGIAGFPNGEIYRVGNPAPQPFVARLYAEKRFNLNSETELVEGGFNQIKEKTNSQYLSILAGKFALTDFFDNSSISHDPRTQFMNWALMGSGAWDYGANTRGYTFGVVLKAKLKHATIRFAETAVPLEANGAEMQWKLNDAAGSVLELELNDLFKKNASQYSTLHIGSFLNRAHAGNYETSIKNALITKVDPDITDSREYGRAKYGFYVSLDNHFNHLHHFIKGSWSDGENETWAFTEIDNSVATGLIFDGNLWKRKNDNLGLAIVNNGISDDHSKYLKMGGTGFMLGDGNLNYGRESTIELFYSFNVWKKIFLSPDFQYTINPGYNKDRGPVTTYALRFHAEL